jgi:hypothetical protein
MNKESKNPITKLCKIVKEQGEKNKAQKLKTFKAAAKQ